MSGIALAAVVMAGLVGAATATGAGLLTLDPGTKGAGAWQTIGSDGATVAIGHGEHDGDGSGRRGAVRLAFALPPPFGWAAVVVLAAPNGWGQEPGPAFDLAAADRLTLMARGREGGERVRLKVATAGDQAFGDSSPLPFDSGWLTLSSTWQRIEVPLDGQRLGRVVTPLVVIANRQHNPSGHATVWLDDIRFEGREIER
jgi:hypothetical protein